MQSITRDGVRLCYEEAGIGAPPMLLVHGFGGNHSHFAPQLDHFRRSHRVVAVDRRGHGESDKPTDPYTIASFADDLAWLCDAIGLYQPVLVVHSMDAIGFDFAARYPDRLAALVLLDTPTFAPAPFVEALAGAAAGMKSPAYLNVIRGFADQAAFAPTDNPERKAHIVEGMSSLPQHVLASTLEQFLAYDRAETAARCQAPLLHIGAWFPADLERLRTVCPQLQTARCVGTGHFAHLEAPDQVNAMIERFLAVALGRETVTA
ncbi:MAG: alpha/beta hydrolase [Dehalococcoidia bacterium]